MRWHSSFTTPAALLHLDRKPPTTPGYGPPPPVSEASPSSPRIAHCPHTAQCSTRCSVSHRRRLPFSNASSPPSRRLLKLLHPSEAPSSPHALAGLVAASACHFHSLTCNPLTTPINLCSRCHQIITAVPVALFEAADRQQRIRPVPGHRASSSSDSVGILRLLKNSQLTP